MIIWINGAFGAGKTTTAALLAEKSPGLRTFDPESVGYLLRDNLADFPVRDFRDWESWRVLVPVVADELVRFSGQGLVAPQTVLEEAYWDDLLSGLTARGHDVVHVLVEADGPTLRRRIEADQELASARQGRLAHLSAYAAARPWMARRADLVVDSTHLAPGQVADQIWDRLPTSPGRRLAPRAPGYLPGPATEEERQMAEEFKKGDKVTWQSHGSTAHGHVEDKITSDTKAAGRTVRADDDDPQYLVRSEKSGRTAVHRPEALKPDHS